MAKEYHTTRRFPTKKKTTTKEGKREYQKMLMRQRRKAARALISVKGLGLQLRTPAQNLMGTTIATDMMGFKTPRSSIIAEIHGLQGFNNKKPRKKRK
jgi:hypothetical protein